ncbi:MAG: helix-turn-helix domain-containing protein, partial [Alphaproteobacteria bacterium]
MAQQQQQPMHLFDREPGQDPKIVSGPFADMAMPSVGAGLRDARLGLGQDLSEIASALRIRHAYLEAIEEERFGDLP